MAASLAAPVFNYADSIYLQMLWYFTAFTTAASAYSYYHYGRKTVQVIKGRWESSITIRKEAIYIIGGNASENLWEFPDFGVQLVKGLVGTNHVIKIEVMCIENKLDHGHMQNFQCIFKHKYNYNLEFLILDFLIIRDELFQLLSVLFYVF